MKNIGLLLTKNEAPIIYDVLAHNVRYIKELFVLDGGDDETRLLPERFPGMIRYFHEREFLSPGAATADGIRQFIFKKILEASSPGDWVTIMHGDEMFYHDPNESIAVAQHLGCNLVRWYAAHFFPHRGDLKQWDVLKSKPVHERFTWYAHYKDSCWIEDRQFKITGGMHYEEARHASVLPLSPTTYVPLPACPIYRHFKVWDLNLDHYQTEQSAKHRKKVARPVGKWGLMHYTPKKFEQFFIRKYPRYPKASRFDGSFGKLAYDYERLAAGTPGLSNVR